MTRSPGRPSLAGLSFGICLTCGLAAPCDLAAQLLPSSRFAAAEFTADTPVAAPGFRAGVAAANQRAVVGRVAAGFLGGLPVGFFGPHVVGDMDAVPIALAAAGVTLIMVAATAGDADPPEVVADSARQRGPAFEGPFREAYSNRLETRREGGAMLGALAGTATGFLALLYLLSKITT